MVALPQAPLAMVGAVVVILFYLVVLLADFLAYADPEASEAQRGLIAPQAIRLFDEGRFRPHVNALVGKRDPATFKRVYAEDPTKIVPLTLLRPGLRVQAVRVHPDQPPPDRRRRAPTRRRRSSCSAPTSGPRHVVAAHVRARGSR